MAQGKPSTKKVAQASRSISIALPDLVGSSFASSRSGTSFDSGVTSRSDIDNPYTIINDRYISAKEMINACRNAYTNVGAFRTSIDIMADLANTNIHLDGGNAQSIDFFNAWLKRIGDFHLKDQFFREACLSGSIIFYRIDAKTPIADILKLNQNYAAKTVSIPTKYILFDAASICLQNIALGAPVYYKILNPFELDQLKRSDDGNDQLTYKTVKQAVDAYAGGAQSKIPIIQLDPNLLHTIFYQKQDYQPFPIPMGYSVLEDVNLLRELKRADQIIAKTVDYIMLVITMGSAESAFGGGTDPIALNNMKSLFQNGKIGRVLVSDYTTEVKFVTPEIDKIINPQKYEEVDKNIASGMMNIFFGEQKYADSVTKLKALTRKLEQLQELFLREFLNPEIKRISKQMNFKSYPIARMEPIRIEDQTNTQRIYAQLVQLGILSAEDAIDLFETGLFPSYTEVLSRQEDFRKQKDKGYFQPILGGPYDSLQLGKQQGDQTLEQLDKSNENALELQKQGAKLNPKPAIGPSSSPKPTKTPAQSNPGGRPPGTKTKQTTKKVSQTGASSDDDETKFSQKKVVENSLKLTKVKEDMEMQYKDLYNIKRISKAHRDRIEAISELMFANEAPDLWEEMTKGYLTELDKHPPVPEIMMEIEGIKSDFEIDHESAIILYHSKV